MSTKPRQTKKKQGKSKAPSTKRAPMFARRVAKDSPNLMTTVMSILALCMKAIGWAIVVPKTSKVKYLVVGEPPAAEEVMNILDVRPPLDRRKTSKGQPLATADRYACPFCKHALTTLVNFRDGIRVQCDKCGALGPPHKTFEGTELAWNGQSVMGEVGT